MQLLLNILKAILFASMIICMGEVAYTVHRLRPEAELTLEHVNRATIAAGAAAGNVEKASRAWQASSEEQSKQTTQAMYSVKKTAAALATFVSRTNESLNGVLLPQVADAIHQQNAALLLNQNGLQQNLQQMSQATIQLQSTLADADKVIADPNLKLAIENLTKSSENTAEATKHLANVADAGEQTARYYQKKLTTPASFAEQLFRFVLNAGSQARILLAK